MPPTPIPDGYGEASYIYSLTASGERFVTTCGFHNIGSDSPGANAAALAGDWLAGFPAAVTLDSYTFEGVYVLQNLGGTLQSATDVMSVVGTVNAAPCSPAIAARVTKSTLFAGRKWRGRMYLPPALLSEANVNGAGIIDSATVASLQAGIDTWAGDANSDNLPGYLLHHDGSTPTACTVFTVRNSVGTQRRRQHLS